VLLLADDIYLNIFVDKKYLYNNLYND